jgi:gas vesicle protein
VLNLKALIKELEMQTEDVKQTMAETVSQGGADTSPDLRDRVRDATVAALRDGKLSLDELRSIGRSLTEGISLGLSGRGSGVKEGLSQAVSGMGQAYGDVSERISLAIKESMERNKNFKASDLKEPLERLKCLEEEFRAAMKELADKSGKHLKGEWNEVSDHFTRVGSDFGGRMRENVETLYNRLHHETRDVRHVVKEVLGEGGSRVTDAASGLMAGMSEVLKKKDKDAPPASPDA